MTSQKRSAKARQPGPANDIHYALIKLLLEGGGLKEVAEALSGYLGAPVLIATLSGTVLAGELPQSAQADFTRLMRWATRHDAHSDSSLLDQARQAHLYLAPLKIDNQIEGLLLAADDGLGPAERQILEQGTTIATLALIQYQAVYQAEQRSQRDILEDLLLGEPWSGRRLQEQGQALGWQFEAKPVVLLLDYSQVRRRSLSPRGADPTKLRRLKEQVDSTLRHLLAELSPDSILAERHNGFIILPHLPGEAVQAREQALKLTEAIIRRLEGEGLKGTFALAGGGFHAEPEGLRASFQEAQQALDIGSRLLLTRPVWFEEVQLYLILERSSRAEEVRDWFERTVGALVEYDRRNKTNLLQTLELFFDTNQTLQEAAHALHIHPNTLKYRLGRIEQILGQNPFKGENQLRYYLATKMARLL